ncbi:hypothetical protein GCM10020331_044800 [Ectobacillus funiculus]
MIAVIFMTGIGIMIAEQSTIGTIACVIGLLVTMGYGFATKTKASQGIISVNSQKLSLM